MISAYPTKLSSPASSLLPKPIPRKSLAHLSCELTAWRRNNPRAFGRKVLILKKMEVTNRTNSHGFVGKILWLFFVVAEGNIGSLLCSNSKLTNALFQEIHYCIEIEEDRIDCTCQWSLPSGRGQVELTLYTRSKLLVYHPKTHSWASTNVNFEETTTMKLFQLCDVRSINLLQQVPRYRPTSSAG